jgi:predicted alpha/beta hydrolase
MPPTLAKLAGLGALGAIGFFVALYALIVYGSVPRTTGGIDRITAVVTWISVGVVVLLLSAFHVVIARQLFDLGRGVRSAP